VNSALVQPTDLETEDIRSVMESWDPIGSREERAFCMWINSLGTGHYVTNLKHDTQDGLLMLRVFDKIETGIVKWQRVNMNPNNAYKKLENCNLCVVLAKAKLNFSLVGVAGKDIYDGNLKLILALVWQACKHHLLKVLRQCGNVGGRTADITESDVLQWAKNKLATKTQNAATTIRLNRRASSMDENSTINSLLDPALRTALPLIILVDVIASGVVRWNNVIVYPQNDDECLMNARYVVGLARKLGCFVFCVPEDICELRPKMILTFLTSLMCYDVSQSRDDNIPLS